MVQIQLSEEQIKANLEQGLNPTWFRYNTFKVLKENNIRTV